MCSNIFLILAGLLVLATLLRIAYVDGYWRGRIDVTNETIKKLEGFMNGNDISKS